MRLLAILGVFFLAAGLIVGGCGAEKAKPVKGGKAKAAADKGEDKPAPEEPETQPAGGETAKPNLLDLAGVGIEATIEAPEGTEATASEWGDITIKKGDGFDITITEDATDLAERKQEIKDNDVNKLKGFEIETDDTLLYCTEVMGKEEYHFITNVRVGGKSYTAENTKGPSYTKEQAEAMMKASRSMKAK